MAEAAQRRGVVARSLDVVERLGNKLPSPFILFVLLALGVIVLSWFVSLFGVTVEDPESGEEVAIQSLISGEGLQYILTSMVENFVTFPPLGLVIGIMLGIGLAQQVGVLETAMKRTILSAPASMVTFAIIVTGVVGNIASDAAFIIVPPLAALVFLTLGRHPLAGMAAGFAAVGAGFTANIFIAGTDALLSGIATEAAAIVNDEVVVTPVSNWYFMSFSVLMLMIVGVLVTERVIEPRLGEYQSDSEDRELEETTPEENRGLRNAVIAGAAYLALLVAAALPSGSPLRNEDGGLVPSPLLDGIVPIILLFFVTVAVAYGVTVGKITTAGDVPKFMGEAMKGLTGFIVLIFAAAQFIAYFEWTNLGIWFAVNGAQLLESLNLTGILGLLAFSVLTAFLNLIVFSGSAQWALEAPIFVPLFMLLDINPAYTQVAFRIADSSTNIITPLNPYVPMVLAFMRQYDEDAGFGTLFSLMLPYAVLFYGSWVVIFLVWYLLGLPVGPGEYFTLDQ
jgi:aminobenzoyl-glutamate transport protein